MPSNFPEDDWSGKGIAATRKHFAEQREAAAQVAKQPDADPESDEDEDGDSDPKEAESPDEDGEEAAQVAAAAEEPSGEKKQKLVPVEDVAKQREKKRLAEEKAAQAAAQVGALQAQLQQSNKLILELRSQMDELRGGQKATQDLFQKLAPQQEQVKQAEPTCPFDAVLQPGEYFDWHMDRREAKIREDYEKKYQEHLGAISPKIEEIEKHQKLTLEEREAIERYNEFQGWLDQQTKLDPLVPEYFKAAEEFYTEFHPGAIESGSISGDVFLKVGKQLLAGKSSANGATGKSQGGAGAQPEHVRQVTRKQTTPSLDSIGGSSAGNDVDQTSGLSNAYDEDEYNRELRSRGAHSPEQRRRVIDEMNAKLLVRSKKG